MRTYERIVMIGYFRKEEDPALDLAIAKVLDEMHVYGPDSDEFPAMLAYLERLNALKTRRRRVSVSPDTMAIVVGNLLGILIIVAYEHTHVITTKGLGFLFKPKAPGQQPM